MRENYGSQALEISNNKPEPCGELSSDEVFQKNRALNKVLNQAIGATEDLKEWLEREAPKKTGASGIGKAYYSWYQRNVHLVPLNWSDEVMLLKRELARAWSSLTLEEHKNRNLPQLKAADSEESYHQQASQAADELVDFLARK
jgi:hypothetical protein